MDYLLILIAVVCITIQFSLSKFYQKKCVKDVKDLLLFVLFSGIVVLIFLLGLNKFKLSFSKFSFIMAGLNAIVGSLSMILGIIVVKYGKISVYTTFMMIGGMILPYFYGTVFLDEAVTPLKIAGLIILTGSLMATVINKNNTAEKTKKLFFILCAVIFMLNGSISIISKAHQINAEALPTNDFAIWASLFQITFSTVIFFIYTLFGSKNKREKPENTEPDKSDKPFNFPARLAVIIAYAVISCCGGLMQLFAAKTLPASVLFPLVTGLTIILTTLAGRVVFKEKISALNYISLGFTFIGIVLFSIV